MFFVHSAPTIPGEWWPVRLPFRARVYRGPAIDDLADCTCLICLLKVVGRSRCSSFLLVVGWMPHVLLTAVPCGSLRIASVTTKMREQMARHLVLSMCGIQPPSLL